MKKIATTAGLLLMFTLTPLFSCKKKKDTQPVEVNTPAVNNRQVNYEISGNYSGQLLVVYYDNISGNKTDTVKSLPWSKEIIVAASVSGIGIAANSIMGYFGAPSQAITIRIYSAGKNVKEQTSTADNYGAINAPSLAYVF